MRAVITLSICLIIELMTPTWAWADKVDSSYRMSQDPRYQLYKQGQHYRFETKKNLDKSLSYHLEAAKADYAVSQYAVGYVLGFDKDRDPDYAESLFWMLKVIGTHETPQIPKYKNLKVEANKALRKLCKRGVVDFPESHPFSKDPYCWRKRGDKLFYGRDKLGEFFGGKKHGVEQDYVKSRYYLEKAYEAGQVKASINLAKIYGKGLGVEINPAKYQKYVKSAAELGDSKTHLSLAEQAKAEGRIVDYIEHLEIAAKTKWPLGSKASRTLGKIYFEGELVPHDFEKALMHFFLSGKRKYAKGEKLTLPGENSEMIRALRNVTAIENIDAAKVAADDFAIKHKFSDSKKRDIKRSYGYAVRNFHYVQRTGGQWYKDRNWWVILIMLLIIVVSHGFHIRRTYYSSDG